VLVVGASGGIGRLVVAAARRHELNVTALVRDLARAEHILPGVELAQGDLEQAASLAAAVRDVGAIVFTHDGPGSPDAARRIDHGGVANVLRALDDANPRIAAMTSSGVSRRESPKSGVGQLLDWKRRSERLVRASGCWRTRIGAALTVGAGMLALALLIAVAVRPRRPAEVPNDHRARPTVTRQPSRSALTKTRG
jgi:uncharacterized protein YbjT (DUF2867 family)